MIVFCYNLDFPLLVTDENRNELAQLISENLISAGSAYGPTCVIRCDVEDVLLGDPPAETKILITVPADSVEPGTKKTFLLSGPADAGSIIYILASKHSFYSLEEAAQCEELNTYMGEFN